ncbi:MAG: DUF2510 domain-containing protein [Microbacterium sp.]|nr:DUF2510 domain-containing protein [Microbacterium sp.]
MSNVPAGWYPNPDDPTQVRYWDGAQWTLSTAPAVAPAPAPAAETMVLPTTGNATFAPPPAPAFEAQPAALAPVRPSSSKKWLIGGAIAAGVIVVGSVGAAIGSGNRTDAAPEASTAPVISTPSTEPVVEEPSATPTPTPQPVVVEVVDAVAFRAQAGSHLDDMQKDLDDIVTTVNEDGFWRLLSNSGELAFNLGQLEALDVPANVAETWPAALTGLETSLDALTDAISTQDGPTIIAAVDAVRGQVESSRGVVGTAQ